MHILGLSTPACRSRFAFAACLCFSLLLFGCGDSSARKKHAKGEPSTAVRMGDGPIKVVCTTEMVADIVREVGGDQVEVDVLMGEGVDPHMYRPSPKDNKRFSKSDMIFYNGLHLEAQLIRVLDSFGDRGKPVYAVTQELEAAKDKRLIDIDAGNHDPHVWNDPEIWADCIDTARDALIRFDEKNKETYESNATGYRKEVVELIKHGDEQFGQIPEELRILVTAHDAFAYLAARYGFEVFPIQGVSTEAEASVGKIDELVETIVNRKVKAVFAETSVNQQYRKL